MGKNIGKKISKHVSGKCSQKFLNHNKQSTADTFKTVSKREIQKTAEATGDLTSRKIADAVAKSYDSRITKTSIHLPQNNSETVTNEHDKEIPKERYRSPEEIQKIIDNLRLI